MNWKKLFSEHESHFGNHEKYDWISFVNLMQKVIKDNPGNVDVHVRTMYDLLIILLDEEYSNEERDIMMNLLKKYFDESYSIFSNNAEYLFFMGYFIGLAEWYFGQTDLILADEMKRRSSLLEPDNILYEWSRRFCENDPLSRYYAEQLLKYDIQKIEWLKSKGTPGIYILECLEMDAKKLVVL